FNAVENGDAESGSSPTTLAETLFPATQPDGPKKTPPRTGSGGESDDDDLLQQEKDNLLHQLRKIEDQLQRKRVKDELRSNPFAVNCPTEAIDSPRQTRGSPVASWWKGRAISISFVHFDWNDEEPEDYEEDGDEDGEANSGKYGMVYDPRTGKVLSEAAIDQRVRRACQNGKKKKATGGPKAVEMYKDLGSREELTKMLISAAFKRNITKFSEKTHKKKTDTVAGWYTESAMSVQLEEIKEIVDYTSTRPALRRKYKYNAKKLQHWVDKETIGVDSSETIKGTRKEVSTNDKELPSEADGEVSDFEKDEKSDDEHRPSQKKSTQEDDLCERAEKTMSDLLPPIAKMHELSEKFTKPYNTDPKPTHARHASELDRLAGNMEAVYDALAEVLANLSAHGESATGESIWADAKSRLEEPDPPSAKSIYARLAKGSKHRAEKNAFREPLGTTSSILLVWLFSVENKIKYDFASPSIINDRLQQSGHTLQVDIDYIPVETSTGIRQIPWLDPYKMVSCLARDAKLEFLHGKNNLLEWWRRFAKVEPGHRAFKAAARGDISLERTIPFFSHGDEGRGKKKKGILIWSLRGCVGFGTRQFQEMHSEAEQKNRMGLNMSASMTSRFLHVAVPKAVYGKNAETVWDAIGRNIAASYERLETKGFLDADGKHYHAVCVGLTGDNPFLAKVAHLERSFARVAKSTGEDVSHGICWRCLAGTPNVPFENLNLHPEWSYTIDETLPWSQLPPFLRGLGFDEDDLKAPRFLEFDIWHNFHGGTGKHIAASTVAEILPNLEVGSIDFKFSILQQAYETWRKKSKLTLHIGHFDRELFGMEQGYQVLPVGCWSKFSDTRVLLCFLEDFLRDRALYVPTEITEEALICIAAGNRAFRLSYQGGYWLSSDEARSIGLSGLRCLQSYAKLAFVTLQQSRSRYPMMPKSHYLHHCWREIILAAKRHAWVRSPLATSVQMDEDFVGHMSRMSRRVGNQQLMLRTLQRYLVAVNRALS
ncbi:unnamed protein product, partial [Symbiodinium sp. CCMP2592]